MKRRKTFHLHANAPHFPLRHLFAHPSLGRSRRVLGGGGLNGGHMSSDRWARGRMRLFVCCTGHRYRHSFTRRSWLPNCDSTEVSQLPPSLTTTNGHENKAWKKKKKQAQNWNSLMGRNRTGIFTINYGQAISIKNRGLCISQLCKGLGGLCLKNIILSQSLKSKCPAHQIYITECNSLKSRSPREHTN